MKIRFSFCRVRLKNLKVLFSVLAATRPVLLEPKKVETLYKVFSFVP